MRTSSSIAARVTSGLLLAALATASMPVPQPDEMQAAAARLNETLPPPPCVSGTRDLPITEFTSQSELQSELARLERVSEGRVELEQFGVSNRDRPLVSATVGTGDDLMIVTSEIHGNEKAGTDALLRTLEWLGTSESGEARRVRDRITLVAVPHINPDGSELDRRGNDRSWEEVVEDFPQLAAAEPAWNYQTGIQQGHDYGDRPGFDLNRDFHPDLEYQPRPSDFPGSSAGTGWFIHPESQALRDLYVSLRAEYGEVTSFVDLHHQGPCVAQEGTNDLLDVAVDYPPLPEFEFEPGGKYEEHADVYAGELSRQLSMAAYDEMTRNGFVSARYPHAADRDIPGQARSSFALNGTGTVLFEVRGQTHSLGQEGRERFVQAVEAGLRGMLTGLSTGSVHRINADLYDTLPDTVTVRGLGGDAAERATAGVGSAESRQELEALLN